MPQRKSRRQGPTATVDAGGQVRSDGDASSADGAPGHVPVLLNEALGGLDVTDRGTWVDATFGGGGHTRALLRRSAPEGRVIAIDADPAAAERGAVLGAELDELGPGQRSRFTLVHGNFRDIVDVVRGVTPEKVDGVLFDLGLSSFQLDTPERGFAFRFEGPLDMRFDNRDGATAADLVNTLPETDLANLIYQFGDEHRSRRIAAAITARRGERPFTSTADLARVVERAVGGRQGRDTHPATRTFQALRIATNGELDALRAGLAGAVELIRPGGRLAVISFHSLEDRIVKRFIAEGAASCVCPPQQPVCTCGKVSTLRKVGGAIRASAAEQRDNPRSRSATLRVAEVLDTTRQTEVKRFA